MFYWQINECIDKSQACNSAPATNVVSTASPPPGDNPPAHLYHPGVASPTIQALDAAGKRKRSTEVKKPSSAKKRRKSQGEGDGSATENTVTAESALEGMTPALESQLSPTQETRTSRGRKGAGDMPSTVTCTAVASSLTTATAGITTTTDTLVSEVQCTGKTRRSQVESTPPSLSCQVTSSHLRQKCLTSETGETPPHPKLSSPTRTRRQQTTSSGAPPDPATCDPDSASHPGGPAGYPGTEMTDLNTQRRSASAIHLDTSVESLPSAASLHSPTSESFHSAEDDPTSPRKEKRHRDGSKKKKKDKDKELEGGRKRKKHHHRDKHGLGEMASEIVTPFRIKV